MATTGEWNIGGINLPDLGITEKLGIGSPNPLALAQQQGTTSGLVTSGGQALATPDTSVNTSNSVNLSPLIQQQGQVQGTTTTTTQQPQTTQQTSSQPSGAPPYPSNTENQTVSYNGQTFKSDGNGGWILQSGGGPSEADLNAVYEPTMNYLNQAEAQVRADQPMILDTVMKAAESAFAELSGNKQKNLGTIQENTVKAGQRKEDALSAARRLFDELRKGYSQRFGGASSAGQAANEIAAVEQQRQQGGVQRDYGTTIRQIEQSKQQLEQDYQAGTAKIQEVKSLALQQAQTDFTNKLLQIQAQRAQTEAQKAAAKLQALTDLRNQAWQIQQQAIQNQQQLDLMYKQQQMGWQDYAVKLNMAGQGSQSAINQYLPPMNPTSNLQANATGVGSNQVYTGKVGKIIKGYDTQGNPIYG